MTQVMLAPERLMEVRDVVEKIDEAARAVEDLADGENQTFRDAPRLSGLRDIARRMHGLEAELQRLFA